MKNIMYLWTKIKYDTGIYGTSIYEWKHMEDYKKMWHFDLKWKKNHNGYIPKQLNFFNKYITYEL